MTFICMKFCSNCFRYIKHIITHAIVSSVADSDPDPDPVSLGHPDPDPNPEKIPDPDPLSTKRPL